MGTREKRAGLEDEVVVRRKKRRIPCKLSIMDGEWGWVAESHTYLKACEAEASVLLHSWPGSHPLTTFPEILVF